jgi:hypothetical protein
MRIVLVVQALFFVLLFGSSASAQYYSFEEACRNAGLTTGACAPKSQQRQSTECVKIGGNAFHAEKSRGDCIEATLSPVFDAEIFVELLGLPNINKMNELGLTIRRSVGFNNAVALFHKGARTIIHDPEWARTAGAEFYLVLGHEVGHHFCGHTLETAQQSPQEAELEADRFSGASIKRFEVYHDRPFLNDALTAAARLYSASGSRSHPARAARVEAVKLGYTSGSPCGNLAPAIRGFSPQRR